MTMPGSRARVQTILPLMPCASSAICGSVYAAPDAPGKGAWHQEEREVVREQPASDTQELIVLVAEDEETIAETLSLIVEDAGFTAIVAHNGREALALARQHRPQLIITDLMMPYLSGTELIATLRRDAAEQGTTPPSVIVVTAASPARAEASGADVVVPKPFDVKKIEAAIYQLMPGERP
jgi:CheY-like chemotaxis protein